MSVITRRHLNEARIKKILKAKLASRRFLKLNGPVPSAMHDFLFISYLFYMKKLGKESLLLAAMERKRTITKEHVILADKRIRGQLVVKKKQKTLVEMLPRSE